MIFLVCVFSVLTCLIQPGSWVQAQSNGTRIDGGSREAKAFSVFNIVKFKNGPCASAMGKNGTCYLARECAQRNGVASGSCASGYGVCCIFSLQCGEKSSEAHVFLVKPTGSNLPRSCAYTISKYDTNICRIRLEFNVFDIAGPGSNVVVMGGGSVDTNQDVDITLGDCNQESFTVTSPGSSSPPVICGFNTGQHMVLDASDGCHEVVFNTAIASASDWDIKVSQFKCGSDEGGPVGCLQYFTGVEGSVASFNFPTQATLVPNTATHLSNQCYSMCFRQEPGHCAICYIPVSLGNQAVMGSFGLSNPNTNTAKAVIGAKCVSDYLRIPGGQGKGGFDSEIFKIGTFDTSVRLVSKYCGRFLGSRSTQDADGVFICSQMKPFRIDFNTGANEEVTLGGAQTLQTNELVGPSSGTTGFNLKWSQILCPDN